ncbi:MAG: insulinase family protein [Hyphomicrobium sp.]
MSAADVRYNSTLAESVEDVQKVTLAEAKKFHADFVGASNSELSIVGDFDPAEMEKLVTECLAHGAAPVPTPACRIPIRRLPPVTKVISTPDKQNAVFLAGQKLNLSDSDPDYPALVLGNYMLGGGFLNSRLAVRIRQKDGLSYGVQSGLSASTQDKNGTFQIQAIAAPQNVEKVEAAAKEEVAKALKDGFTADEVSAAKSAGCNRGRWAAMPIIRLPPRSPRATTIAAPWPGTPTSKRKSPRSPRRKFAKP